MHVLLKNGLLVRRFAAEVCTAFSHYNCIMYDMHAPRTTGMFLFSHERGVGSSGLQVQVEGYTEHNC